MLTELGFKPTVPDGGYFVVTDVADVAQRSGVDLEGAAFCRWLTTEIGVAAIPLSAS